MSEVRTVDVLRLGLGVVILARPQLPLRLSTGQTRRPELAATRVLGARYVAQSVVGVGLNRAWGRPYDTDGRRRWLGQADAAVDLVHALSMAGLSVVSPRHRRVAAVSAVTALGFAALDLRRS
jgi:hypothetical protein